MVEAEREYVGLSVPKCPKELHERLYIESGYQKTTLAQVIISALEDYLSKQEARRVCSFHSTTAPSACDR